MYLYDSYSTWRMPTVEPSIVGMSECCELTPNHASRALLRPAKMSDDGIDQSGYIDIKQPPRVKGRKLKSWKKKWVVVSEMSILPAGRSAAKVDVYTDETTAQRSPADKHTFILEFVTEVRAAKSKKHAHAFEIVESEAVLLLAGDTEMETQTWMMAFRRIFWPDHIDNDFYTVTIKHNEHSRRLSLEGAYRMSITPEVIGIQSDSANSYEWSLHMLKRFHMEKEASNSTVEILTIECGPKSECGEATFHFNSDKVTEILAAIKKNIFIAINKQKTQRASSSSSEGKKWRTSVVSASSGLSDGRNRSESRASSEQRFKDLLESPAHEEKRIRLMTQCSENSIPCSDRSSITDSIDHAGKRRHSVTFDMPEEHHNKGVDDLLSSSIEILDEENAEDSEYNRVEFTPKKPQPSGNIISTITIAQPGHKTNVLLDEHGYSHVDIKKSTPQIVDNDKSRSLSNISSQSSTSCRSASVGSRDSGIVYSKVEQLNPPVQNGTHSNRSTNSFDSAVSTSSTMEQSSDTVSSTVTSTPVPYLKIEIEEVHTNNPDELCGIVNEVNKNPNPEQSFYQDLTLDEEKLDVKPALKKSNSTGNVKREENQYEDLDKFRKGRKNLVKHLGMEPGVNPSLVPPALPARPQSHKVKRKYSHADKKLFTLPFARNRKKHKEVAPSISSSSDSDTDSLRDGKRHDISLSVWPLSNKSVMVDNDDLYQPVAIERFLKDNDGNELPQKRERSSSLNLNKTMPLKRPSVNDAAASLERKSAMWKHNRNVSMHVDLIQRHKDSKAMLNRSFGNDLMDDSIMGSKRRSVLETVQDNSHTSREMSFSDDEPIYAEVQPLPGNKGLSDACAEPFPNLEEWKPPVNISLCNKDALDDTVYENDDDSPSKENRDVFNQGFCSETSSKNRDRKTEPVLIDFVNDNTEQTDGSGNASVKKAVDIFHLGAYPLMASQEPLVPMTGDQTRTSGVLSNSSLVSNTNAGVDIFNMGFSKPETRISKPEVRVQDESRITEQESIYMDMSVCKNESIYVMPSTLK